MSANLLSETTKGTPFIDDCTEESWEESLSYYEDVAEVRRLARSVREETPKKYRIVYIHGNEAFRLDEEANSEASELGQRFRRLAEQWRRETGHYSLTFKRAMHPAYQRIIGMGRDAIPHILRDLQERPTGHWFWALNAITGEDFNQSEQSIDNVIQAWFNWGRKHGYI